MTTNCCTSCGMAVRASVDSCAAWTMVPAARSAEAMEALKIALFKPVLLEDSNSISAAPNTAKFENHTAPLDLKCNFRAVPSFYIGANLSRSSPGAAAQGCQHAVNSVQASLGQGRGA